MRWSPSLSYARRLHSVHGGWLLRMSDGSNGYPIFLVTDNAGTVEDLRGADYVALCEKLACWDETRLPLAEREKAEYRYGRGAPPAERRSS